MAYENKPNTFVLFKNENKRKDTDSDYTGTFYDGDCVEHWLNVWINETKDGRKYMKGSVGKPKEQQQSVAQPKDHAPDIDDSDLPF